MHSRLSKMSRNPVMSFLRQFEFVLVLLPAFITSEEVGGFFLVFFGRFFWVNSPFLPTRTKKLKFWGFSPPVCISVGSGIYS